MGNIKNTNNNEEKWKSFIYRINDKYQSIGTKQIYEKRLHVLLKAEKMCEKLNKIDPFDDKKREKIYKKLFKSFGKDIFIRPNFRCEYGKNISIGNKFICNFNCVMLDCADIEIGNNVMIGPNVNIFTINHDIRAKERNQFVTYYKPITICDNVWIGGNSTILPGVTIGKNSVVGAGSVVTKDVPPNVLVAGNPAKFIRNIDNEEK